MYCRKGGVAVGEHVLFGKYRLCRKLGSGRSGSVYLAFHIGLEEYRAIKIVPKSFAGYETFRKEALLLKTLRHPGIPIVYDVEEDVSNSYLIEEYLEGESLFALVKRLGNLSTETAIHLGIQICRLLQFLYSAENPILYLDLQPKNLLICGGNVKLIDFDHAKFAEDSKTPEAHCGTVGFAAPEQFKGEPLDCRTDIYAIGALLYFMRTGKLPKAWPAPFDLEAVAPRELSRLIRSCTAWLKEERYQSMDGLFAALTAMADDLPTEQARKSHTIVFAGARPGLGVTHAALGLSSFLAGNGYSSLYREENFSGAVRSLAEARKTPADVFGIYRISGLHLRPLYGRNVQISCPDFPLTIKDMGASWSDAGQFEGADFIVLVCGGKEWERASLILAAQKLLPCKNMILLFNHVEKGFHMVLPEELGGLSCLRLPFFPNPFAPDEAAMACYEKLLTAGTEGKRIWKKNGLGNGKLPERFRRLLRG